jgi:hypothetical protein
MEKRLIVFTAAGCLVFGCSMLRSNLTAQPRAPALPTTNSPASGKVRGLDGGWRVFFSWGCGSYSEAGWILHADGTFYSSEANGGGTWTVAGSAFRLTFDYSPHTTYVGTVDAARNSIEGTMESDEGKTGCWHAKRDVPASTFTPSSTSAPR